MARMPSISRLARVGALAAALVLLATCTPRPTAPKLITATRPAPAHRATAVAKVQPPKVLFDDEFSGTALRSAWYPNRWFATTCSKGATTGETQYYSRAQAKVAGGYLRLTAQRPAYTCNEGTWKGTLPYSSGWVQTGGASTDTGLRAKPGFTFLYGHVDVRFREPAGKGLWPGIWLAADGGPGAPQSYPWPPEIDLLESYGDPTIWSFHVHLAGSVDSGRDFVGPNTSTQFHTVSLDWRPTKITWSIDGKPAYSYTGRNIPKVPMYLIVNLATGGAAGPTDTGKLPATMLVDYVRVHA